MKKSAVVTQSNYIPWKGYFDQISSCDHFVYYDCVQYTRRDWRNRNKIKTPQGLKWLTIPLNVKGNFTASISSMEVADHQWAEQHWDIICQNYRKADCFKETQLWLQQLFEKASKLVTLSSINRMFIEEISNFLGIETRFHDSSDFILQEGKNERLLGICRDLKANKYISGPAAKEYMDVDMFLDQGIEVEWFHYSGYPEYSQPHGEFEHGVSIVDLLLSTGSDARNFIKKSVEDQLLARAV